MPDGTSSSVAVMSRSSVSNTSFVFDGLGADKSGRRSECCLLPERWCPV
jgi:16S rRNA C1402 (ribose-2'-O) methylase RsmI